MVDQGLAQGFTEISELSWAFEPCSQHILSALPPVEKPPSTPASSVCPIIHAVGHT